MITRQLGIKMSGNAIKKLKEPEVHQMFDSNQGFMAALQIRTIKDLSNSIKEIERQALSQVKMKKAFEILKTIPGVGNILALTIMLEVGEIKRFAKVGCYSSYCRCDPL